jgi:Domain of Unknown Function (DUF1080)
MRRLRMTNRMFLGVVVMAGMVGSTVMAEMLVKAEPSAQPVKPEPVRPTERIELFNGKDLNGWTKVIKAEPEASPDKTWRVEEGIIKCTGKPFGYLRTQQSYADFKLKVEYRWADTNTVAPNSGIFTFTTGPDTHFLPKAIESQLKMGRAGDWVLLSSATMNGLENKANKSVKRQNEESSEKPRGEWNQVEIVTKGNTIQVSINGVLQNTGKDVYTDAGQICLQSEGGAVDFRNVTLEPVEKQ